MIKLQTVLYENEAGPLTRFLASLAVTVRAFGQPVSLHIGDCSGRPLLAQETVDAWQSNLPAGVAVNGRYTFFGENLGFSTGHNRLWREVPGADRILILNADSVLAPHLLSRLSRVADARPDWGAVEARQIPLEHPKPFDLLTGETAWVSGACCLMDATAFDAVEGYDEHFFLYAEDVDLSWRLRDIGKRLYFCADTFVYHAKRLTATRQTAVSPAETYYGPLSNLLLRAKYGRTDLNTRTLELLRADPRPECARTLAEYERVCQQAGWLSAPQASASARFAADGGVADHRWTFPLGDRMLTASEPATHEASPRGAATRG